MKKEMFEELLGSVREGGAILRGQKEVSRRTVIPASGVRGIREKTSLSQSEFAGLIGVSVKTLQNWEQARRRPAGPAAALLRIIEHDPPLSQVVRSCVDFARPQKQVTHDEKPDRGGRYSVGSHAPVFLCNTRLQMPSTCASCIRRPPAVPTCCRCPVAARPPVKVVRAAARRLQRSDRYAASWRFSSELAAPDLLVRTRFARAPGTAPPGQSDSSCRELTRRVPGRHPSTKPL